MPKRIVLAERSALMAKALKRTLNREFGDSVEIVDVMERIRDGVKQRIEAEKIDLLISCNKLGNEDHQGTQLIAELVFAGVQKVILFTGSCDAKEDYAKLLSSFPDADIRLVEKGGNNVPGLIDNVREMLFAPKALDPSRLLASEVSEDNPNSK